MHIAVHEDTAAEPGVLHKEAGGIVLILRL